MQEKKEKNLYMVTTRRGWRFYVVAETFTGAANAVKHRLDEADYGYYVDREVRSVELIRSQRFFGDKQMFSGDDEINFFIC